MLIIKKGKQQLITTEQKKMRWTGGVTNHYMRSIRQELMKNV